MNKTIIVTLLWIVLLAALMPSLAAADTEEPHAREGLFVIGDSDTGNDNVDNDASPSIVSLSGEWEFYWHEKLEPGDFTQSDVPPAYIEVPSSWKGSEFPRYGYGTYRLRVQLPEADVGQNKALFIRAVGSAYRIWIDGVEVPGLGTVGDTLAEEVPKSHINLVFFQPSKPVMELVIQVSNHSFREGGLNRAVLYGDTDALIPGILKELLYDIFVIGGFLMMGLYYLIVFGLRRNDLSPLFVGLVSLAVSMRTMFINGYLSVELLHIESWEWLTRLEYWSEIFGFITFVFLMRSLYPREVHKSMVRLAVVLSIGLFLFVGLTPARIYTESMLLQSALKAAVLVYFIVYVGIKAFLRKREGALIHLFALILLVCALVNDTLYYLRLIDTVGLLSYSIIPFIMTQAVIVSHRYARLSRRNDALLEELGEVNMSLEQKVADRTQSLHEANERRTRMLANIAHDLGTPLLGIQTYLQLIAKGKLPQDAKLSEQLLDKTVYVKRLVDDLFELSKLESRMMAFAYEDVEARSWIEELHGKFAAELLGKGMRLHVDAAGLDVGSRRLFVCIDKYRMLQVLQNFIDNAVKFSRDKSDVIELRGTIRTGEEEGRCELVVEVTDYGKGLTEAEQAQVFNRFYANRENNESGSGLGLAIVQEIVERHQGRVGVRSAPGAGSIFYFSLPASLEEG